MDILKGTHCLEGTCIKLVTGTCQNTVINSLKLSRDRFSFISHDTFLWSKLCLRKVNLYQQIPASLT